MNFLLFFLSVAAFGLPVNQASHEAEVESLLSLNGPKEDIFGLIAKLRKYNTKVVEDLVKEKDTATTHVTIKEELKTDAVNAETQALGDVVEKQKDLAALLRKEKAAESVEKNAKAAMDSAQKASAAADHTRDTEVRRLNTEKSTCEQILTLLTQLAGTVSKEFLDEFKNNRRLLSIIDLSDLANADPAAIGEVEDMVKKLLIAGEAERARYIKLAKDAKALSDEETKVHKDAEKALFKAVGLRKDCQDDIVDLQAVAATATKNAKAAKKALQEAQVHLATVAAQVKAERERVVKEEKVFSEVEKLLNTLA